MKYVLHILQPVSETIFGGADMHVLDLAIAQKQSEIIEPIILIRKNIQLKKRFEKNNIRCFCGSGINNILYFVSWVHRNLKNYNFFIIHSHGYDANYQMALLKEKYPTKWKSIPTVITSHGWIENNFILKLKTHFDFYCHRYANAHIVCSEKNLYKLKKYKNQFHIYIPNGVSPNQFNQEQKEEKTISVKTRIAYVGRLSFEKRVDIFIQCAFQILNNRNDDVFYIYGDGFEYRKLKQQVTESEHSDKIIFYGQVEDRNNIYRNIDILILPSDTESTPRVLLEAMCFEIPLIATDVGDVSRIVRNGVNGFLVKKGDISNLVKHLDFLLSNRSQMKLFGKNGKKIVNENFLIDDMNKKIFDVCRKINKEL